eukprot:CAMPEP_0172298110 /NCGR_PEP_ID=MMETSP1058-20130122/901_1 /TAXON_ID=83371 /ORGANISM="Detonula confervacea, Strain CCMP 353" /LENGTH=583 /DNA_ID=CAMNT_0013007349 /DNA_START=11 /DNA_END=1762 /DNA_ORIENTATION=-
MPRLHPPPPPPRRTRGVGIHYPPPPRRPPPHRSLPHHYRPPKNNVNSHLRRSNSKSSNNPKQQQQELSHLRQSLQSCSLHELKLLADRLQLSGHDILNNNGHGIISLIESSMLAAASAGRSDDRDGLGLGQNGRGGNLNNEVDVSDSMGSVVSGRSLDSNAINDEDSYRRYIQSQLHHPLRSCSLSELHLLATRLSLLDHDGDKSHTSNSKAKNKAEIIALIENCALTLPLLHEDKEADNLQGSYVDDDDDGSDASNDDTSNLLANNYRDYLKSIREGGYEMYDSDLFLRSLSTGGSQESQEEEEEEEKVASPTSRNYQLLSMPPPPPPPPRKGRSSRSSSPITCKLCTVPPPPPRSLDRISCNDESSLKVQANANDCSSDAAAPTRGTEETNKISIQTLESLIQSISINSPDASSDDDASMINKRNNKEHEQMRMRYHQYLLARQGQDDEDNESVNNECSPYQMHMKRVYIDALHHSNHDDNNNNIKRMMSSYKKLLLNGKRSSLSASVPLTIDSVLEHNPQDSDEGSSCSSSSSADSTMASNNDDADDSSSSVDISMDKNLYKRTSQLVANLQDYISNIDG